MARSGIGSGDPNTPWWYQTPSLTSQSTTQTTFPGISQLSDPFTPTSEGVSQDRDSAHSDDSDNEGKRSFLITTVDTSTGQSLTDINNYPLKPKSYHLETETKPKYIFRSTDDFSSEDLTKPAKRNSQVKPRSNSESTNQIQELSSSAQKTAGPFRSSSLADKKKTRDGQHSTDKKSDWLSRGSSRTKGSPEQAKKTDLPSSSVASSTAANNGVVNFTVNCQIHLVQAENGDLERSNSNIELIPSSHLPMALPGSVAMVTGGPVTEDQAGMTRHSTITEEDPADLSGLLNQDKLNFNDPLSPDPLTTPLSPVSSEASLESQLSHSMTSANQDVLNYLWPQLMQYINPNVLCPWLSQRGLITADDISYITSPLTSDTDRKRRVLGTAPVADFDSFVECVTSETSDSGHVYLARRMREAIERKRNNPFKRLSSLRGKGRGLAADKKPSPLALRKERHSPRSSASPSPKTPTKQTTRKSDDKMTFSFDSQPSSLATTAQRGNRMETGWESKFNSSKPDSRYESSTLPRKLGSAPKQEPRGMKIYSSARYSSANTSTVPLPPRRSKLSRHGSFQGNHEGRLQVTPLLQDSSIISQENSDVLENLSHFKTSVFNFPGNTQEERDSNFFTMMKEPVSDSQSDLSDGLTSMPRRKKSVESNPYTTIPENAAEAGESHDIVPPIVPVKQRRLSQRNNYTPMKIRNQHVYHFDNEPTNQIAADTESDTKPSRQKRSMALKRGTSLYGVGDSPSRNYPMSRFEGRGYMPSALSPDPSQSCDENNPPPVPTKQRTHRRTASYDTSQPNLELLSFPSPQKPTSYRHLSLRRDAAPSSMSTYSSASSSMASPLPSNVPIISTQDSGITSTSADSRFRSSSSGYSLSTDPGSSVSRYSGATPTLSDDILAGRKFEWLQERVSFKKSPEEIQFSSRTHFNQERVIINSGVLYEHGAPKFLVLMTDMLLILKPRKKSGPLPRRLGSIFSHTQTTPTLDWFSDMDCVGKMPLMLHHLSVRSLSKRKEPQVMYLHYDNRTEMVQFALHSVSKEAKDIWVEALNTAIMACTRALATTVLTVGNPIHKLPAGPTYTKLTLTIVEANNVAVEVDVKERDHFCTIQLGEQRCKTPNVKAQCWPSWNYQVEFVDFSLMETVWIEFYTERVTSPDVYLGGVDIQLMAVAQRLKVNMTKGISKLQLRNQHLPLKNGKGTLTVNFELGWMSKDFENN